MVVVGLLVRGSCHCQLVHSSPSHSTIDPGGLSALRAFLPILVQTPQAQSMTTVAVLFFPAYMRIDGIINAQYNLKLNLYTVTVKGILTLNNLFLIILL